MSTGSIDTSGGLTSSSTLTNDGADGALQITGLASGINTNEIIQAELAEQEMPLEDMQSEISGMQTVNNQLTSFQTSLQNVSSDAQALGDPSLFFPTQSVTSSNSSLVTATSSGGVGSVIGSSTIEVSQLASAAQRTFNFTSPSSNDTLTVDGQSLTVTAGQTAQDVANTINGSNTYDVWASVNTSGQLVLSNRSTGNTNGNYINVSDAGGSLVEDTADAQDGQDAEYTINGVAGSSTTDTVTGAIPGVTLALNGINTSADPVTVTVDPPSADTASIISAVQQFVSDYNSSINSIESAVNTAPASETTSSDYNPNDGSLFGDDDLENLLSEMRDTMYQPGAGLPTGMAALSDIGITTGASTGTIDQNSVDGDLTVDTATLTQAIESNPSGVEAVLQSWSNSFQTLVNNEAGPGGSMSSRIEGNTTEITDLQNQYSSMQTLFNQQEQDMEEQWASVEATLSQLHDQSTSLSSFATAASSSSSSSSSSS
jgi:flagellar hook-associated protein 2